VQNTGFACSQSLTVVFAMIHSWQANRLSGEENETFRNYLSEQCERAAYIPEATISEVA